MLAEAHVTFYPLTDEEINRYLETGTMRIKQGHTASKMLPVYSSKEISGDYYSIVGFPR
ncbi:Maf family protein [Enterococcus faecalis]|nr:Maf family protein [Enterococcus faecalis]